jgi:hypothetical protein
MKPRNIILLVLGVTIVLGLILTGRRAPDSAQTVVLPTTAAPAAPQAAAPVPLTTSDTGRVPRHFNSAAEAGPLPSVLPAGLFQIPVVARAYSAAARIPQVLAQQPCYCFCDKMGHGSLLDCFATDHGAG